MYSLYNSSTSCILYVENVHNSYSSSPTTFVALNESTALPDELCFTTKRSASGQKFSGYSNWFHVLRAVQNFDGVLQKVDTHGTQTLACAIASRPGNAIYNPIQTHVHRVEEEETAVFFVVAEAFVVGGVHLHL